MKHRLWLCAALVLAIPCAADAADIAASYGVGVSGTRAPPVVTLCPSSDGSNSAVACGSAGGSVTAPGTPGTQAQTIQGNANGVPVPVVDKPPNTAGTNTPCTVGTSSAQCLAAGAATTHLALQNNSSATIACNVYGAAAVLASGTSLQLLPGQRMDYGPGIGWVPTGAVNCIASAASSALYAETN